jgi:hypothetical protein
MATPNSPTKQEPAIYHGTFIDCETPTKLSIRTGYVWVNSNGKIDGFAEDKDVESPKSLIEKLGWSKDTLVTGSEEYGFLFPGFIGTSAGLSPIFSAIACLCSFPYTPT